MRRKTAQGLSINTIIILALALIVLVVLSALFINRTSIFSKQTEDCELNNGFCANECSEYYAKAVFKCPKELPSCCLKVLEAPKAEIVERELGK